MTVLIAPEVRCVVRVMPNLNLTQEKAAGREGVYRLDWVRWLEGRRIVSSRWEVEGGTLAVLDDSFTDTATTVRLSGGMPRSRVRVRNYIEAVPVGPVEADRTFLFVIKEE